jgi:hypothetical protein
MRNLKRVITHPIVTFVVGYLAGAVVIWSGK